MNNRRIAQLGEVIQIMKRTEDVLDTTQVLNVIQKYSEALELLDSYDHQTMTRPKGNTATYELTYDECIRWCLVDKIFGSRALLFANFRQFPSKC